MGLFWLGVVFRLLGYSNNRGDLLPNMEVKRIDCQVVVGIRGEGALF